MDDWSVEVFDSFPDRPVYLTPGKRLPFDVAVADKDYNGASTAWVYWAPGSWNGGHIGGHLGTVVMGPSVLADAQIVDSLINTIVQRDLNTRLQQQVRAQLGALPWPLRDLPSPSSMESLPLSSFSASGSPGFLFCAAARHRAIKYWRIWRDGWKTSKGG